MAAKDIDGYARCREIGLRSAELFLERLLHAATRAPLGPDELRHAFEAFRRHEPEALKRLFAESARQLAPPPAAARHHASAPKRTHALERSLVSRFERHFDPPDADAPRLSRRLIIAVTVVVTSWLGVDTFRRHDAAARDVAAQLGDLPDLPQHPRMRHVVDCALVDLARGFGGEFVARLKTFTDQLNARLGAPKPGAWDADWELTRPLTLVLLESLYADLRGQWQERRLSPDYGADAETVLDGLFAGLDAARKLAERPWLRRPIG